MTTGQRIAAKRKEENLSQESLGEVLGVSRQSIYKWESDSSLPEIDKLVAMSRLFHVSVGWLLGVEEEPETPDSGALSESQMKLVEEILSRYQQANQSTLSEEQQAQVDRLVEQKLSERPRPRRRRWPYVLAALAAVWGGWTLLDRLERVDQQYNTLASSVNNVTYSVNSQIGTITNRVEEVLKGINDLTADYGTELVSADLAQNTVTFSLRVVPKTYVEGMEVLFLADTGNGPQEFQGQEGPGREFTAQITCELTDSITLSAVLVTGDTRQTQLLDNYSGLYSSSLPTADMNLNFGNLWPTEISEDGKFHLDEMVDMVHLFGSSVSAVNTKFGEVSIREFKLGLFQNRKLVQWLEPCEKPDNYHTNLDKDEGQFFRQPELALTVEEGDTLIYAALVTDQYGRQAIVPGFPWVTREGDTLEHAGGDGTDYFDVSNYTF